MRKSGVILIWLITAFAWINLEAQSNQGSSGLIDLQMKKKVEPAAQGRNVSSTTFTPTKREVPENIPLKGNTAPVESKVSWISPSLGSVNTARGTYDIQATITANENLQVVNVFLNDTYLSNVTIPNPVGSVNVQKTVDLKLGTNVVRLEGITLSGQKVIDKVFINYDLASARFHALIIAVEDYDDPAINDLEKPIDDATRFYRVISSRYTFNEEDITFLKNPTKADIIGTLHKMRDLITEEDNLLIYYAGHGYWDEEMETGYWLPCDAEKDNPVNWLPNTDLTNYINVLKSKHTLLVADACFSGGIFKTRRAFDSAESIEKLYRLPSRKAITSGNLQEVPDESKFIEYTIESLRRNNHDYYPASQLFRSIEDNLLDNSDQVPRYGTIQKVGDQGGDFMFILRD